MERKIGEIFEYNGEWYQCVVSIDGCRECSFRAQDYCTRHSECLSDARSDGISVIFRKLEKVGIPFSCNYYGDARLVMMQEYQLFDANVIYCYSMPPMYTTDYKHKRIAIEIKVNKEDMGENDIKPYDRFFSEGTVSNTEHLVTSNLKPFDIQKAREGKPVCTRDGRKARIVCFDVKGSMYPIIALIEESEGEKLCSYMPNGRSYKNEKECIDDLMMLPEKKEGWVNVAKEPLGDDEVVLGYIFNSYEDAVRSGKANERYVATVRIEWEE